MKSFKFSSMITLGFFAMTLSVSAQAHFLWFEPVEDQPRLYFGEYADDVREKTGGRLDTVANPQVRVNLTDDKSVAVGVERKEDHLAIKTKELSRLHAKEVGMEVKDLTKNKIGIVKPMYYARFTKGDAEAVSQEGLDIQPLGKNKARVNLNGKPVAKTKVFVYAPNRWMQEMKTNDAGEVVVSTPWPGLYVIEVVHLEPVPGSYQGVDYEAVRHVSTLSLIQK